MPPAPMTISYSQLLERVGHYLYGVRTGFTSDQISDIQDCIRDGLNRVYAVHHWSCFRPVVEITTTAPFSDGTIQIVAGVVTLTGGVFPVWSANSLLKVGNKYYSVDTRDSDTQVTLVDTSASLSAGSGYLLAKPDVPLPDAFEAISGDSDLTYYHDQTCWYPSVKQRPDVAIRRLEQRMPEYGRPHFYAVRKDEFDPTVGSRRSLVFYPTPDAEYILRVPMILRPVMIDTVNEYPIGGEQLSQLILEACLASAEHNFEEREHVHEKRFVELVGLAIQKDKDHSSPTSLGRDGSVWQQRTNLFGDREARQARMGNVTLDGDLL